MHVTTKEVDTDGTHILTSVIEGDGATALASDKAKLTARVISVQRTASGGVQVQTALTIEEPPQPVAAAVATPKDEAITYFVNKGFTTDRATAQVERFGPARVLAMRDKEKADEAKKLDVELEQMLAKPPDPPASPAGSTPTPAIN